MKSAFLGVENLIGCEQLKKLAQSHFLIIGVGGVGSWIAEFLIRSGCEKITLVDLDEICVSNTNRQVHTTIQTIGKSKVVAMKERLLSINPDAKIELIEDFLTASTIDEIITEEINFVFDAIDSVKNKCLIIQKCRRLKLPFIIVGGAGQRIDPSLIEVKDLNRTINDKLLFQVRKMLRREFGYSKNTKRIYGIPSVYSKEVPMEIRQNHCEFKSGKVSNCESGLGSAGFVTSTFASVAVSYAFRKLSE